jgi:hypothetical protein
MKIRKQQVEALERAALRAFEDEMVVHLGRFSPPLFKATGEDAIREAIRLGIERAGGYGLTLRGPVRLYLELMLLFGSRFDTDPQYPWAAGILIDRDSGPQMQRADLLYERTMDYRKEVAGPEDAFALEALAKIRALAREPLRLSAGDLVAAMRREIAAVYPQKAAHVGADGIDALIREGIDEARRHRFEADRAVALVVVLMLAFGHGCSEDPLYPWIGRTLKIEAITDPEARARRLESKALTWLDHVLAHFEFDQAGTHERP